MNETNFLVQVMCMTYNQVNYITDAMNGFVMQQTSFPYVCIIIDDASTDGEPDVIKKYLDDNFDKEEIGLATEDETDEYLRIYARHKENKNCYFCVLLLKYNHYSIGKPKTRNLAGFTKTVKYVALCEGDDYWTDPLKLQKQVDFLESNVDYVVCAHRNSIYYESEKRMVNQDQFEGVMRLEQNGLELSLENYFHIGVLPQILSLMFRNGVLKQSEWYHELKPRSKYDQTMIYAFVELGKIWVINEKMGVYRRHSGGVATSLSRKQAAEKMYLTWHDVYEVHSNDIVRDLYLGSLKHYYYYLVKHGVGLFGSEIKALKREYRLLKEPLKSRMSFSVRLLKGFLLRWVNIGKNEW